MQTVLITGIGKGIGRALAEKFLAEGYFVIGTFLSSPPEFSNENLVVFPLDLSSAESIKNCAAEISKTGKKIDILINNAGVLLDDEETKVVIPKLRKTLEVNLIGTIDFTEQIIPLINKGGHIINISSTAGSLTMAADPSLSHFPLHYPCYKISKTALNMFTRTLSFRLKDSEITVSSVHPGWVKTDMGGPEAEITPREAAEGIYGVAVSRPNTGGFWFQNEQVPW